MCRWSCSVISPNLFPFLSPPFSVNLSSLCPSLPPLPSLSIFLFSIPPSPPFSVNLSFLYPSLPSPLLSPPLPYSPPPLPSSRSPPHSPQRDTDQLGREHLSTSNHQPHYCCCHDNIQSNICTLITSVSTVNEIGTVSLVLGRRAFEVQSSYFNDQCSFAFASAGWYIIT